MIIALIFLIPIIVLQMKKKPETVFILTLIYPVMRLPFFIIFDYEIGFLNIVIEVLCVVSVLSLTLNSEKRFGSDLLFPVFTLLITSIFLGLFLGNDVIPITQALLGVKLLLLPFLIATVARFDEAVKSKLIVSLLYIQIVNCFVAIVETVYGISGLQELGFQYGTNIRNFESFLRAPGLALTNYELGSFSSVVLVIVYLLLTNQLVLGSTKSYKFYFLSGISALTCLALSNFRSGILFSFVAIMLVELFARRKLITVSLYVILSSISILTAIMANFFLLNSQSFVERQDKWSQLLSNYDWIIGSGIGFSGAASLSSYAAMGSAIVTDNQYISVLLQLGLVGFLFLMTIFIYLFFKGDGISKSLVLALMVEMVFAEMWDFTVFFSICLYLIFSGMISKRKLLLS